MSQQTPRKEPRFPLGANVTIALSRSQKWRELAGFTVNASEHGLLVTLNEAPRVGETVRVKLPEPGDFWGEAVVCHAVRGTSNYLVGMRLKEKHGTWLVPQKKAEP